MSRSVESSGKTIEQALQRALKELDAKADEVDIEILEGANKGFLGGLFGSKTVSIRVTLRDAKRTETHIEILKEIIRNLLSKMGVDYELTIEDMPDTTFINVNSSGVDGLLIGRRGETLSSLQHVVNRVFTNRTGQHSKITIDVGGYVKRKHRLLVDRARKSAERVRKTGRDFDFEPLKASDRRIIHLAVSELNDMTTYTIGDGLLRKVVITSKANEFSEKSDREQSP
jgi:spoIIIJ-associated protein